MKTLKTISIITILLFAISCTKDDNATAVLPNVKDIKFCGEEDNHTNNIVTVYKNGISTNIVTDASFNLVANAIFITTN